MRCPLRIRRGKKIASSLHSYPEYPKITDEEAYGKSVKPYQLGLPLVGVPMMHIGFCIDRSYKWGFSECAHVHKTGIESWYNHMCIHYPSLIRDDFGRASKFIYHEFGHVLDAPYHAENLPYNISKYELQRIGHGKSFKAIMAHMGKPELGSGWL